MSWADVEGVVDVSIYHHYLLPAIFGSALAIDLLDRWEREKGRERERGEREREGEWMGRGRESTEERGMERGRREEGRQRERKRGGRERKEKNRV